MPNPGQPPEPRAAARGGRVTAKFQRRGPRSLSPFFPSQAELALPPPETLPSGARQDPAGLAGPRPTVPGERRRSHSGTGTGPLPPRGAPGKDARRAGAAAPPTAVEDRSGLTPRRCQPRCPRIHGIGQAGRDRSEHLEQPP
ncbi:acidic proline-rich protein PRP25-like [Zonotrichia leucophrys gambelii]|uniref:acidic proline-rich protein PRP25-like n=1 Tax=Zonotrichia leucophrys gambelii TaxID=257770 RepID=UPI0031402CD3